MSKLILFVPVTSKDPVGLFVPIPTLPSTTRLFEGGFALLEYVDPMITFPDISSLALGLVVPIPTLPSIIAPCNGAVDEVKFDPIEIPPATSKIFVGVVVPTPTLPPLNNAAYL